MQSKRPKRKGAKPMNGVHEQTPTESGTAGLSTQQAGAGQQPELDLDRLIWDPEYRKAVRDLIKRGP
jgi:hypothetical protein